MIIENSEIGYLRDQDADKGGLGQGFSRVWGVENLQKRHIYLHTFTVHALGHNGTGGYNTPVISNL